MVGQSSKKFGVKKSLKEKTVLKVDKISEHESESESVESESESESEDGKNKVSVKETKRLLDRKFIKNVVAKNIDRVRVKIKMDSNQLERNAERMSSPTFGAADQSHDKKVSKSRKKDKKDKKDKKEKKAKKQKKERKHKKSSKKAKRSKSPY